MNLKRRFTLLVKGNLNALFDSLEDPERSLHQLILDMEEQLDAAKRAAAQAMANEERLRARIAQHREATAEWEVAAKRALDGGDEATARDALRRAEEGERQAARLAEQLAAQEGDTRRVRESVERLHRRVAEAQSRQQLLQARLRQSAARRAIGRVAQGVATTDLAAELDRLGERIELDAAEESAYLELGAELSGDDLKRRCAAAAVDEAVESRLERLRRDTRNDAAEGTERSAP